MRPTRPPARASLVALACRELGDDDTATLELEGARAGFDQSWGRAGPGSRRRARPHRCRGATRTASPIASSRCCATSPRGDQQGDRRRARAQRAHGGPPREQHLHEAGRLLAGRGHGLRARASTWSEPAGVGEITHCRAACRLGGLADARPAPAVRTVGGTCVPGGKEEQRMAVAMVVDNPHGSQEHLRADARAHRARAAGRRHPATSPVPRPDGGWRVIEVFDSEHDARRFFEERVAAGRGGGRSTSRPRRPQVWRLHTLPESGGASDEHAWPHARNRMLAGLPVDRAPRIRLAGVSTAVLEGGDGPPLVLLHGGIECGGAYWAPVIERLAEQPPRRDSRRSRPRRVRAGRPAGRRTRSRSGSARCSGRPARSGRRSSRTRCSARWRRATRDSTERSLSRLVIYAAPGVGPYRMPLGLRDHGDQVRAAAVRAERRALRPLGVLRLRRGEASGTPGGSRRSVPTRARARDGAARQADDAAADRSCTRSRSRRPSFGASASRPDLIWGQPRPLRSAERGRVGERAARTGRCT